MPQDLIRNNTSADANEAVNNTITPTRVALLLITLPPQKSLLFPSQHHRTEAENVIRPR